MGTSIRTSYRSKESCINALARNYYKTKDVPYEKAKRLLGRLHPYRIAFLTWSRVLGSPEDLHLAVFDNDNIGTTWIHPPNGTFTPPPPWAVVPTCPHVRSTKRAVLLEATTETV